MQTNDMNKRFEMQRLVDEEESQEDDAKTVLPPTQIRKSTLWPYLGIILATMSSLIYSLQSAIVKYLVNVHPIQLSVYRFTGILLTAVPIVIWRNECPFPKGKRLMLFLRSFSGSIGLMLANISIRHMPLADSSVLISSFPVFVTIFARLFLKEPCGLFHVIAICITLIGVVLISRPPFIFESSVSDLPWDQELGERSIWAAVALSSALFTANSYIFVRALKGIHFSVILFNLGAFALILNLTTAWGLGVLCWPQCGTERLLTVAVALFSCGSQILLTIALKLEHAGPVSLARSSNIVFAFLWQILFFQEMPNGYTIMGAFLVTSSVLLNGLRKWALELPRTSMIRKMFCIFKM